MKKSVFYLIVLLALVMLAGCRAAFDNEEAENSTTVDSISEKTAVAADSVSPEKALDIVKEWLSDALITDSVYLDLNSASEKKNYRVDAYVLKEDPSDHKLSRINLCEFYVDKESGDAYVTYEDKTGIPLKDFDASEIGSKLSGCRVKNPEQISVEEALKTVRNALAKKPYSETIKYDLKESYIAEGNEYVQIHPYTVSAIPATDGSFAEQSFTVGWFYVDKTTGKLYCESMSKENPSALVPYEPTD